MWALSGTKKKGIKRKNDTFPEFTGLPGFAGDIMSLILSSLLKSMMIDHGAFHCLENKWRVRKKGNGTTNKTKITSEQQPVTSKSCHVPSSVSEPQFLKCVYFQVHAMYKSIEDSNLKYHPATKHLETFLASTMQIDVNNGFLFSQLNPDTGPNAFRKGEQYGVY